MEALDSPPQTELQIIKKNNTESPLDVKSKEDNNCLNESSPNKADECNEDDKVVHQNNKNLELQKQKLILYNNLEDEELKEQHSKSDESKSSSVYLTTQEDQEKCASSISDDSIAENQDLDDRAKNLSLDISCSKSVADTENNFENSTEKSESSFQKNFSESSIETSDSDDPISDNLKAFQNNVLDDFDIKATVDYFPLSQKCKSPEETARPNSEYENESESHASNLKHVYKESNEHGTELRICSPKINGNHKEIPDSTCDSTEQGDMGVEHSLETEKFHSENPEDETKEADLKQKICYNVESFTNEKEGELFVEENKEVKVPINIGKTASRCSTPDSVSSCSTAHSSSSQQLVIDQPTDEEKIYPHRLAIKTKQGKTNNKKRSNILKKSNKGNKKGGGIKLSTSNASQNTKELEDSNSIHNEQLSNTETEIQSVHAFPSSFNEPKDVNGVNVDAFMVSQVSCVPQTDCNKTSLNSSKTLNTHSSTCPSLKSIPPNYYKCTSCCTYHENWSFFLHIREQHDRFLCLYCIKCFPTAEKLSLHLEIKHDLEQNHFNSEESFRNSAAVLNGYALETRFLMCCTCQHVFGERVAFTEHVCIEYMKSCALCGQKGRHTSQCKAHPFVKRRNKKKVKEKQSLPTLLPTENSLLNVQEAASTQCQSITVKSISHNEDSNSSSNMVIDESCTTIHNLSGVINDFNATAEPESAAKVFEAPQEQPPPQLMFEELDNANASFLKLKLRVPKEFQKPVDAVISSSESDDGVYEEEIADDGMQQNATNLVLSAQEFEHENFEISKPEQLFHNDSNESSTSTYEEKLSSVDEDTNPHIARILEEIEQTKLDIKRTKENIHNFHSNKDDALPKNVEHGSTSPTEQIERPNSSCLQATEGSPKRNWTPTPPASPKATESNIQSENITFEKNMELETNEDSKLEAFNEPENAENSLSKIQSDELCIEGNLNENLTNGDMDKSEVHDSNTNDNIQVNSQEIKEVEAENIAETQYLPPSDGIEVANEDCLVIELQLDRPIEKYEPVELVRICLKAAYPFCLYCNHARRIAVNGESLVLHLIAQHRFSATVDSITAEELRPETIVARLKTFLPQLQNEFFNTSSYCTIGAGAFTRHFNERIFECFQCRFVTTTHKELYLHNRKMHLRTAILCFMCRCNFFSFSEILCHICPGVAHKMSIFEINFRCCLCDLDNIPSPFRLMVHLRKRHFACDICLEDCRDQGKLSSHVWKHKLHHLCYRCGIAYRNKTDITKHLFWKHGTESDLCKRCLNKRWPHVYHFCVPPQTFVCEVCQYCFTKAMYLTVHKRIHLSDFRYPCTEEHCEEKFISRKLLLKHTISHQTIEKADMQDNNNANDGTDTAEKVSKVEPEANTVCDTGGNQLAADETQTEQKIKQDPEYQLQSENNHINETKLNASNTDNELVKAPQKKKKKKRAKESLEDLNLTAPNLSESGSSSDSESETKSKFEEEPKMVFSPNSENDDAKEQKLSEMEESKNPGNVLDIWKNFLQAQQANSAELETSQLGDMEDFAAVPKALHVCYSDHDYCKMFRAVSTSPQNDTRSKIKKPLNDGKHTQAMERPRSRNSNASSSSSDESSDTSTSSTCSCGPNCSCSPDSSSSSSSSSSENSDSSAASRKRQRKKSERNSRHRKSESISPRKNHSISEIVNIMETDENTALPSIQEPVKAIDIEKFDSQTESFINESDLETAESETDEEYYDEHPQKLASELLFQKRAQLMARTFLSPSHNFDIVENSRPSTPSLPEDVVYEKRKKKKKRERKSTNKSNILPPKFQLQQTSLNDSNLETKLTANDIPTHRQLEAIKGQYLALGENLVEATTRSFQTISANLELPVAQQRNISHFGTPRISEGSSCSDVDGSLKRSKRARRPNKFYGYTSDDESMGSAALGPSLVIGMRAFKPQPPPQLVWNKEDLPAPSKSILNSKKTSRAQKRQETVLNTSISANDNENAYVSLPKRRKLTPSSLQSLNRKRSKKLPPIPRLKIRPALFGVSNSVKVFKDENLQNSLEHTDIYDSESLRVTAAPHEDDDSSDASSEDAQNQSWNNLMQQPRRPPPEHYQVSAATHIASKPALPVITQPLPPTPQTTVFNHKIPPALLPNPDFATLQYFKANNIRYPIRPPAGARAARDGESVYCYCRCPYDEVSEMIACDGDNCLIEWFHFECVGIMVAPQGKWFCAECRPHYSEDLYPQSAAPNLLGTLSEH